MIEKKLTELFDLLSPPVYLFRRGAAGQEVDKITVTGSRFERHRYLIEANQCSCMSWMKIKRCKHLDWLAGNFDRLGAGVPTAIAVEETSRIIEGSKNLFPKSRQRWWLDAEDLDGTVNAIHLRIIEPLGFERLIGLKKFGKANLAFVFTFDPLEI